MGFRRTGVALASLGEGEVQEVHLGGTPVLLVRQRGEVAALGAICPHAGGILADGEVRGARLTCPEHGAAFDAATGAVIADPHAVEPPRGAIPPLGSYPVRVESGMIEVELPD